MTASGIFPGKVFPPGFQKSSKAESSFPLGILGFFIDSGGISIATGEDLDLLDEVLICLPTIQDLP